MGFTFYLVKWERYEKPHYELTINECPIETLKKWDKNKVEYKKTDRELYKCYFEENLKLIDFKSRVFDIISVRIKPSDKIRKIRDKIEGKKYKYSRSELVESYYKDAAWYHKFRHVFGDVGWVYFEDLEDSLPMKRIIALFDSNQDFVLTKTIIGENLYWNYIYNPKTIKYKEIIEKIKIDFAGYNSNNEFYYLNQTKGTYGSEYKFDKKRIKLSKVRKKYFLNVDSYYKCQIKIPQ